MRRVAGIDVGGTFTDLLLYEAGPEAAASGWPRFRPPLPTRPTACWRRSPQARCQPGRSRPRHPRHHHHHQRRARAQGGQGRADHHARLPRHARARPAHAAEALRHDRHVRAADPARAAARGRRAHERGAARWYAARRGAGWRRPCTRCWRGLREPGHPFPACLRQPGARAARRRDRAQLWPNDYVTLGPRAAVGVPRVRARHHGLGERRRAADPRPLRAPPAGRAGGAGLPARPAGDERQRRHRGGAASWRARRPRPSCRARPRA